MIARVRDRALTAALVVAGTALLLAPLGVGRLYSSYYLNLVTWILIFALFAGALDLALGYGGMAVWTGASGS
jgi:ABC-type branched-subunit amino acid transport system permease subunit